MTKHISVLLNETVEGLNIKPGKIYVDATLGYGGHSSKILQEIDGGHLYSFDQDSEAIKYCSEKFEGNENITLIHSNFVNMKEELNKRGIEKVDGILFDLGLSSPQIDTIERGFSFMHDAKLDMRMNQENSLSAMNVVNDYPYEKLIDIFFRYGEESWSKDIAKNIIKNRPIYTTMELVEVIKNSVPYKYFINSHPERKIFQSIRIEVNKELQVLTDVLEDAVGLLNKEGRISIITFHSLEDRIVKQIFNKYSTTPDIVKGLPDKDIPEEFKPKMKLINKKPILPSMDEQESNSRSKSAKLRVAERI